MLWSTRQASMFFGMVQVGEAMLVEAFVAERPIKVLDKGVPDRLIRLRLRFLRKSDGKPFAPWQRERCGVPPSLLFAARPKLLGFGRKRICVDTPDRHTTLCQQASCRFDHKGWSSHVGNEAGKIGQVYGNRVGHQAPAHLPAGLLL